MSSIIIKHSAVYRPGHRLRDRVLHEQRLWTSTGSGAVVQHRRRNERVIFDLAVGYKSVIVPILDMACMIYAAFCMADTYGMAVAALGMLSMVATGLAIDACIRPHQRQRRRHPSRRWPGYRAP
jgi:hypothetical protein